jgi:hypothetical protein
MYEGEVLTSKTEQERAQMKTEQAEAIQKQNEIRRDAEEEARTKAMQERSTREQMESVGPPILGPNTTSVGGNKLLEDILSTLQSLDRKWGEDVA